MFDAERCDLCGDCLVLCPYFDYGREEAIAGFRLLVDGGTPGFVGECVTCVACNEFCEKGARPFDLILQRQEETGVLGVKEENTQLFRNLPNIAGQVIKGEPGRPALSLCSVGDLVEGLFEGPLFEGLTVLKGGEYFCGVGWVHLGAETPMRQNAPRVVEALAATGAAEIVFYHDDCYALFATIAPEMGIDVPFRPVHIIEYLLGCVKARQDVKRLGLRVAYQPPCASRYTPWKDGQLDELLELIGVERVEREHDRRAALCCGSPMMVRDREKALEIKERNIADAKAYGAQAMAYLCPLCVLNLRKVAGASGLENYHLIELVKMATA
jgi:Fe-S oxidoreductase